MGYNNGPKVWQNNNSGQRYGRKRDDYDEDKMLLSGKGTYGGNGTGRNNNDNLLDISNSNPQLSNMILSNNTNMNLNETNKNTNENQFGSMQQQMGSLQAQ